MAVKAQVYNQKGEKTGEISLNETVFGVEMNEGLVHQALLMQQANARNPIAHTKLRGEVRGGGRKPWKQKGTGRARQGSIRAPHFRGGGITFGPRNTRNHTIMMPKRQRRAALFCALSSKAKQEHIFVLDQYDAKEVKTKTFADMVKKLPIERKVLVVLSEKNEILQKSARNLPNAKTILASYLNIKDVLSYGSIMFLEDALAKVEETFVGAERPKRKMVAAQAAAKTAAKAAKPAKIAKVAKTKSKVKAKSE